jgi:hypothetical protein
LFDSKSKYLSITPNSILLMLSSSI